MLKNSVYKDRGDKLMQQRLQKQFDQCKKKLDDIFNGKDNDIISEYKGSVSIYLCNLDDAIFINPIESMLNNYVNENRDRLNVKCKSDIHFIELRGDFRWKTFINCRANINQE